MLFAIVWAANNEGENKLERRDTTWKAYLKLDQTDLKTNQIKYSREKADFYLCNLEDFMNEGCGDLSPQVGLCLTALRQIQSLQLTRCIT